MSSPVLTRDQAVTRLSGCEQDIRALNVVRLALFGSVLRGQTHATSDVDFIVQFAPGTKTYARFFALSELLEAHLGRSVELVTTEALSPIIGPLILAEAQDVLRADRAMPILVKSSIRMELSCSASTGGVRTSIRR